MRAVWGLMCAVLCCFVRDTAAIGTVEMSQDTYRISEDIVSVDICVNLTLDGSIFTGGAVDLSAFDGIKAVLGSDYTMSIPSNVSFSEDSISGAVECFTYRIIDDDAVEGEHMFTVSLENPTNGLEIGNQSESTVVIVDDDKVTVSLLAGNEMTITEGAPFSLEVSTVVPADGLECDVVVTVMTTDGSAVDPTDYTAITNQITHLAGTFGTITQPVEISTVNDAIEEADESFSVELSVSDSVGTLGTPSTLEIDIIDDDQPVITESPQDMEVQPFEGVTFSCSAEGSPPPSISWQYLGTDPANSNPTTLQSGVLEVVNGSLITSEISITVVSYSDFGYYRCVASSNLSDIASDNATLTVSPSGSVSVSPINFNAERNSVVSFTCVALGGPNNMFNWTRLPDGEVLTNTSILSFTVSDGSQGGVYRCDVQNDAGSGSSTMMLNVSPALTEIPQDTNSSLGGDLILSCVADGFPVPSIVWVYNGAEIDADSSARITITAEQSVPGQRNSTLIITSAQFSDSGEYVCNATTTVPSFETVTSGPVQVDIQGALFEFNQTAFNATEGDADIEVCVTLAVNPSPSTTDYMIAIGSIDGNKAILGSDFEVQTNQIEFTAGSSNGDGLCVSIRIVDDDAVEGDHDFSLFLSTSGVAVVGANAIVTIMDNDMATISLQALAPVTEGSQLEVGVIIIPTAGGLECDVVVTLATISETADSTDFALPTSQVTFLAGTLSQTTINVQIESIADTLLEGDETFRVELTDASPESIFGSPSSLSATILDDERGEVRIITGSPLRVDEGEQASICLELSAAVSSAATHLSSNLTVTFTIDNDEADENDYHNSLGPFEVIFTVPPGENITLPTDGTHCLTIDTINDAILEGNHSFYVRVSSISNDAVTNSSNSSIEVVITDNEPDAALEFERNSLTVMEATPVQVATVCVVISELTAGGLGLNIEVPIMAQNGTADLGTDFLMPGGTNPAVVTFLASPSVINGHTECVNISIVDDADYEGDQQFSVGFYEVTGPVSASGTVSVTIIDNGDATVTIDEMVSVAESAGTVDVCVNPGIVGALEADLTVTLDSNDGTARAGQDYLSLAGSTEVTFTAGGSNISRCVTFTILDDTVLEGEHEFTVNITDVGSAAAIGDPSVCTVTIVDDEAGYVTFHTPHLSVTEGNDAIVCVQLIGLNDSTQLGCDIAVTLTLIAGIADSQDITQLGTVVAEFFENSPLPVTQCVTIGTINDDVLEGHHNFSIAITSVEPVCGIVFSDPPSISTLEVVIIDNEGPAIVTFEQESLTVSEGSGNVTVCVEMTGIPAGGLGHDVSVSFNAMSGPRADSGVDFSPMDLVVTFTSGTTGSVNMQCISIGITDDDDYEEDQQFEVEIASVLPDTTAIGTGSVVITIQDNNDAVVQLNESALIVDEEEGSVYICVDSGITGNVETLLNVVLTSYSDKATAPADFTVPDPFSVVFPVGTNSTTACSSVSVTSDNELEGDHQFRVEITSAGGGPPAVMLAEPTTVTVTIEDDEDQAIITFIQTDLTVSEEDDTELVCVGINGVPPGGLGCDIIVDFNLTSSPRSVAREDEDYYPLDLQVTFPSGGTAEGDTKCIAIGIVDDEDYEEDHQFTVQFSSVSPPSAASGVGSATVTIQDNEDAVVRMVESALRVSEGSGSVDVCVESNVLSGSVQTPLIINVTVIDAKAVISEDYWPDSNSSNYAIEFPVGTPNHTLCSVFYIVDDTLLEGDHQFTVSVVSAGSGTPHAVIADPSTTTVTIEDDEDGVVSLDPVASVSEGAAFNVCVSLNSTASDVGCDIVVTLNTMDGDSVGGEDFTDGAFTVSFPTGLALPATVCTYLNATDDSVVEGEQNFTVFIESINLSTGLSLSAASTQQTAVILDNDERRSGASSESLSTGGAVAISAVVFVLCGLAVGFLVGILAYRLFVKHRQSVPWKGKDRGVDTSVVFELQQQQQEAAEPAEKKDQGEPRFISQTVTVDFS